MPPGQAGPRRRGTDVRPVGAWRGAHLELTFPGHRAGVPMVATDPRPTRMNYFLGSDPARRRWGVRTYGAVTWEELYPGISLTLTDVGGEPALVVEAARPPCPGHARRRVGQSEHASLDASGVCEDVRP
jgi:hypothetical protein